MPQKTSGDIEPLDDMLPDCFRLGTTTIHATTLPCGLSRHEKRDAEIRAVAMLIRKAFGEKETLSHLPSGAPYIAGSGKQISITHGAGYALLAINDSRPIGIDIESPRPTLKRISRRFLGRSEVQIYNASSSTLLDAWTAKEAIFKALGMPGLTITDIILPDDLTRQPFTTHGTTVEIHFLRLPEFTIALAETHKN